MLPATTAALEPLIPDAATAGNPLDYTAMIWGETQRIADIVQTTADDPHLAQVLVYYDRPQKMDQASTASWDATLDGILLGAQGSTAPVVVASTLPDLLPEETVQRCLDAGVPAVWGLTTGLKVADAMRTPFAEPQRLREIRSVVRSESLGEWMAEHETKELLRASGVPVPEGAVATTPAEAVTLANRIGSPVAMKLTSSLLQHKSDIGALELHVSGDAEVTRTFERLRSLPGHAATPVLVEAMSPPGVELLISARRDTVVPVLVVALGGVWVEVVSDPAIIPLPATAERVAAALRQLRGAALLTGGRGREPIDLTAVADVAVAVGEALVRHELSLIELNPVFAYPRSATVPVIAVDALARR